MEATSHDHGIDQSQSSRIREESKTVDEEVKKGDSRGDVGEKKSNDDGFVVVNINDDNGISRNMDEIAEKICRICHESGNVEFELIELGCDCRGEIGVTHQNCAAAWFIHKGNTECEICGKTAKNIRGDGEAVTTERQRVVEEYRYDGLISTCFDVFMGFGFCLLALKLFLFIDGN